MFHDPPSGYYLGQLAGELSRNDLDACVVGRGATAFMYLADPELNKKYGRILFHQPYSGHSTFIWTNGDTIGPATDVKAAAQEVLKAVRSDDGAACEGCSTSHEGS